MTARRRPQPPTATTPSLGTSHHLGLRAGPWPSLWGLLINNHPFECDAQRRRCLPAPGIAIALLDRSTVFTVWGEARRHAQAFRHLTGDRSSKRAYRVRTRTLHLQSFDPWLRQGSTSCVLGRARRWIFESWLVGLLRCRLVLRHARIPWSCFSRACYFRHDVKPCQ
jgi:hypothetical protein